MWGSQYHYWVTVAEGHSSLRRLFPYNGFPSLAQQLFYSFFKSLVGKDVVVELKNDLRWVPVPAGL